MCLEVVRNVSEPMGNICSLSCNADKYTPLCNLSAMSVITADELEKATTNAVFIHSGKDMPYHSHQKCPCICTNLYMARYA
jgi:hypothetical protein